MNTLTSLILPLLLCGFSLLFLFHRRDLSEAFLGGAKEGIASAFGLLPTLVILLTAVSMFTASGASACLAAWLSPLLTKIGIPAELTSLLLVRPLSGSGSTALLSELYQVHGPDSFVGQCASVLTASSDTLVYVIAVYMAGVKKTRHTLPAAVAVAILSALLSCFFTRLCLGT